MRSALHPIPNNERFQQFRNRWRNLWRDLTPICPSNFFSIRYHRKLETYIFEKFVLSFVLFEEGNISKEKKCYVFSKVFIPQQSGRILLTRNTKHESIKCEEGRRSRNEKRFFTERTKNSRRIEFLRRLGILNENSMKSKHRRMFVINIVELHGWINWRSSSDSSRLFSHTGVRAHYCATIMRIVHLVPILSYNGNVEYRIKFAVFSLSHNSLTQLLSIQLWQTMERIIHIVRGILYS